jgi:putative ABC transport system permease protein
MIKTRTFKSGFKSAWSHKLRLFFMILCVMIGIAGLTLVISIGKATQEQVMSRVKKMFASNTIMVVSGAARMQGTMVHRDAATTLKVSDIEDIARRDGNILNWDAVEMTVGRQATFGGQNMTVNIHGHMPSAVSVWNLVITEGRFFTEAENQGLARVALLAPNIRKELFGNSDAVGKMIEIDGSPFRVVGTIGPRGLDPHGMDQDSQIIMPVNTLLRRVLNQDYITFGKFLVADRSSIKSTAKQMTQIMRERHQLNPGENDDFTVITPEAVSEMIRSGNKMFNLYLPVISVVFLIIGGIAVVNLMLLSVSERVKEVGLRKALGAKSRDIRDQFLIEASSITLFGGFVGVIVGLLLLVQLTKMMKVPFMISWTTVIVCFLISTLLGITAGVVPAKRAAKLQPAESLR